MARLVVVIGPTATGKTRLAVALARRFSGEIISADSRQIYRGLDIGTGKDLAEYSSGGPRVPVHLIDVVDPGEEYHLFRFVADARDAIAEIRSRGRLPIVAGGTILYVKALLDDYALEGGGRDPALRAELDQYSDEDLLALLREEAPELYARVDRTQRRRLIRAVEIARTQNDAGKGNDLQSVKLNPLLLAPYYPRRDVHQRIDKRLDQRLAQGMIAEVQQLHEEGVSWEKLEWFGLEYRYISRYLRGQLTREEMRQTLAARIRRFCRSQDVWFRKLEREGHVIHWIPGGEPHRAVDLVDRFLRGKPLPDPDFQLKDIRYGPRSD